MHVLLVYDPVMLGCWRVFQTVSTVTIRVTEATKKPQLSCYLVIMGLCAIWSAQIRIWSMLSWFHAFKTDLNILLKQDVLKMLKNTSPHSKINPLVNICWIYFALVFSPLFLILWKSASIYFCLFVTRLGIYRMSPFLCSQ